MKKNIADRLQESIQECWSDQKSSFLNRLGLVTGQIGDILKLEEHRRNGYKSAALKKSFGSFGSLNSNKLSTLWAHTEEKFQIGQERFSRISKTHQKLTQIRKDYESSPPSPLVMSFDKDKVLTAAESHLNSHAEVFALLRMAQMELRAKYEPKHHDSFFEKFNWSHLDDSELELFPPVVVILDAEKTFEEQFVELLPLLSSGQPIKVIAAQSKIGARQLPSSSRSALLSSSINVELLPVALQKVFVFQSVFGQPHYKKALARGLKSPRPGLFSVFCPEDAIANGAVSSRTFPYFVYDPSSSSDFVSRLELDGNPQIDSLWAKKKLTYVSETGKTLEFEIEETFADYLLHTSSLNGEFSKLKETGADKNLIPLSRYLQLSANERQRSVPVVHCLDKNKSLQKLVPSRDIILQSADKMASWQALREMAGIENPLIKKAKKDLEAKLNQKNEASLNQLRTEMEAKIKSRETQAVTRAMKNLALRLSGAEGMSSFSPISSLTTTTLTTPSISSPVSSPISSLTSSDVSEPAEVSELPWIESSACTTCDDCTAINKKIFAYNDKKQAYIKDPKGGPFKDIVKAAEKCSPHIIHPGKPQDPNEKDLEKLIKRAKPYQ